MQRYFFALAALLCAPTMALQAQVAEQQQQQQQQQASSEWILSDKTALLKLAGIGLPAAPGGLKITGTRDFSHPGDALDAAILYASPDQQVFATAYVYLPGLAHTGLAALATDRSIQSNSSSPVRALGVSVIRAADADRAAIRTAYEHYRGTLTTRAGFLKAGRYLIKLRVSGPEARGSEVDAAFDDLAAGIRIGAGKTIYTAAPISVEPCTASEIGSGATRLQDVPSEKIAAIALLGTFDGAGLIAKDSGGKTTILRSRVPASLCSSQLSRGHLVLRGAAGTASAVEGRTRLVVILSDGGEMLELVDTPKLGHVLLHHRIGGTAILPTWDGVPSNDQIERMLTGADRESTKVLATVVLRPDKGDEINIAPAADPQVPTDRGTRLSASVSAAPKQKDRLAAIARILVRVEPGLLRNADRRRIPTIDDRDDLLAAKCLACPRERGSHCF